MRYIFDKQWKCRLLLCLLLSGYPEEKNLVHTSIGVDWLLWTKLEFSSGDILIQLRVAEFFCRSWNTFAGTEPAVLMHQYTRITVLFPHRIWALPKKEVLRSFAPHSFVEQLPSCWLSCSGRAQQLLTRRAEAFPTCCATDRFSSID